MKSAVKLLVMFSGAIAPPPAPTNLAITGASGGTVADLTPEATWDAVAGAVTYTLQYSTASDFTGATEVTGIATNSYTTSSLSNFTTYYFRVAGVNSAGQGAWSSSVSVQTAFAVFLDLFDTDDAAPIADPLSTSPAGYNWDVYDTGNKLSIASSVLGSSSSTANWNPTVIAQTDIASTIKTIGGAMAVRFRSGGGRAQFTLTDQTDASNINAGRLFPHYDLNAGNVSVDGRTGNMVTYATDDTWYWAAYVSRNQGMHLYIKGGAFTDWTLVFTLPGQVNTYTKTNLYFGITAVSTACNFDWDAAIVAALVGPFATDTGLATAYQATSTANDTITMAANGLVEWVMTAATGITQKLYVRRVDDDNSLIIECNQAASTLTLIKREGGSDTTLQQVTSFTWTNGTQYRVVAHCYGTALKVLAASGSEWSAQSTTIAQTNAYNQTQTGVKVTHNGGVLASWPLVSASASAQLDALIAVTGN